MKKIFLFLFCVSFFALASKAQVTIGSTDAPIQGAVLELKSETLGFMPPRVDLVNPSNPSPLTKHEAGMVVYNKKAPTATTDSLQVGLYYNNGSKWVRLFTSNFQTTNWFYMPSIVLDVSEEKPYTVDLYELYKEQKAGVGQNTREGSGKGATVPSTGAPTSVFSKIPAKTDLWYYVTDFDAEVFDPAKISIDANGVLSYTVIGTASEKTFMNIVFVEK